MSGDQKRREPLAGGSSAQSETDTADNTAPTPAPQQAGFVVIQLKANDRADVVGRYDDEATALSVARLLAWAGAVARIERES